MRTIIFVVMFFLLADSAFSKPEGVSIYGAGFYDGVSTYLYGNSVRVRTSPEIKDSNILDVLPLGHKVTVLKKTTAIYSQNGFSEYWYKIKYIKDKKYREGYIWGGLLAAGYVIEGNDLILIGIASWKESMFQGECKLIRNGEVVSAIPFKLHYLPLGNDNPFYYYSITVTLYDNKGLSGIKKIIAIYNEYPACGYPNGTIWIGLSENSIHYLITDSSVSEAGVFHYKERIVFPSEDKTLTDEVRFIMESFDFDEKINDYRLSDRKEKRFKWKNFELKEVN